MSLYTHIERKEDLLDLMADEVAAEILVPDGRAARRLARGDQLIAREEREAMLRHPWMVDLAARRSAGRPEQAASQRAVAGRLRRAGPRDRRQVAGPHGRRRLHARVRDPRGGPQRRPRGRRAEQTPSLRPYLSADRERGVPQPRAAPERRRPGAEDNFEQGLGWLLDGISRDLSSSVSSCPESERRRPFFPGHSPPTAVRPRQRGR